MVEEDHTLLTALRLLEERRRDVLQNEGFVKQLVAFAKQEDRLGDWAE